jgi:hypothetical protein
MTIENPALRPSEFSQLLLRTLDASEGRRKRRKRDTTPDAIGLGIRRSLLEATMAEDPAPDDFEGWLLMKALTAPASGPVLALCTQIMDEYRVAALDPSFSRWLVDGAPSADAEVTCDVHPPGECPTEHAERLLGRSDRRGAAERTEPERIVENPRVLRPG